MNEQFWLNNVKVDDKFPSGKIIKMVGTIVYFKLDLNDDVYITNMQCVSRTYPIDILEETIEPSPVQENHTDLNNLRTTGVTAETYNINASVTREMIDDLKCYGIDAEAALVETLRKQIDSEILRRLETYDVVSSPGFSNARLDSNINRNRISTDYVE